MNIFSQFQPIIYICDQEGRQFVSGPNIMETALAERFLDGLQNHMFFCEQKNGPCPETCQVKQFVEQYRPSHGKESV